MWAIDKGHTEIVKALLTAPGINVNLFDVSIRIYAPSFVVVVCVCVCVTVYLP